MITPKFDTSYVRLPPQFFEHVTPDPAPNPKLLALNTLLAHEIGLDADWLGSKQGIAMMSGQEMPDGIAPIAMVYGGHQFGHWSGQLGDGRACLLGELIGPDGVRRDIQLKGSGPTPYARRGDGKSALGPVLREYIVSEAMSAYDVPTTRALAAISTGETVRREDILPGGILVRVAKSHVRIGTFQHFYAHGDMEGLKALADYVIYRHYPQAAETNAPYAALLENIIGVFPSLIAKWMGLGFIHGVMNTDNMQIAGETLDYGPCAFMDAFHPQKVFSSIDHHGRYAWGNQPKITLWNLTQLAQALSPLLGSDEEKSAQIAQDALSTFGPDFQSALHSVFAAKLCVSADGPVFADFLQHTFSVMSEQEVDFTLFFRQLTQIAGGENVNAFLSGFQDKNTGKDWLKRWRVHVDLNSDNIALMQKTNPIYIPRNHQIERIIHAGIKGDFAPFNRLVNVLKNPFCEQEGQAEFENLPLDNEIVSETFCGT